MPRKRLPRPTDGELEILQVLWRLGGRTIREVTQELRKSSGGEGPGTTSIGKRVEIMIEKGLVRRDDERSPKVYYAAAAEEETKRGLLREFMKRVFGGSAKSMMMHVLEEKREDPAEFAELKKRLKELKDEP